MTNYNTLFSLKGKTALITGGTGGLGSAIAKSFLQQGARVAVCSTNPKKAASIEELAKSLNSSFMALPCDLTDAKSINQMLDSIEHSFGNLDILVNSAGINHLIPAEQYDDQTFQAVMDINISALHRVTREVGKRFMIPNKYGRILNLSSVKSLIGTSQDYIAYCTSKGAVNMYTRQLACEWGKYGITCNAIAPTFVYTPINAFQLDDPVFFKNLTNRIPVGRIGKEEDIASAALYLCSDAASFVNGQILCVDGGLTAMQ